MHVLLTRCPVAYGHKKEAGYKFSEKDWTIPDKETPYVKSKYFAERAAWAFVQDLSSEQRFELATVNPMFVLGPLAVEFKQAGTSVTFVKDILSGKVQHQHSCDTPTTEQSTTHCAQRVCPVAN